MSFAAARMALWHMRARMTTGNAAAASWSVPSGVRYMATGQYDRPDIPPSKDAGEVRARPQGGHVERAHHLT
jgi:hypothetical protein